MRRFAYFLFFFAFLYGFSLNSLGAKTLTTEEILGHLSKTEAMSLSAELSETIKLRQSLQEEKIVGSIIIERPNKIFINFRKPSAQTFVSDGKVAWLYTPELNQVIRQNIDSSEVLKQFAFQLGQEVSQLQERYQISVLGEERSADGNSYILKLVPKKKNSKTYHEVKLWVNESGWMPTQTLIYTASGSMFSIKLDRVKLNPSINAGQFNFKVPSGVEVIDGALLAPTGTK